MNAGADFVMYWWDRCADILTRKGTKLRRFGLVTTKSLDQVFQQRVVARWLNAKRPLSLVFGVKNHPWTKATRDAAAVRIAMTAAQAGRHDGKLLKVGRETGLDSDQPDIETFEQIGVINADLSVGTDVTRARALKSNDGVCSPGVKLHGAGFILGKSEAEHLGLSRRMGLGAHIRPYLNGRDLMARSRNKLVIDLFGLPAEEVRDAYPEVYQHLVQTVKPERDHNNRAIYKDNWWIFGEPRRDLRPALVDLPRYLVTVETAKHRVFDFVDAAVIPDNKLIVFALEYAECLSILSSSTHAGWYVANAGRLGVFKGDAVYVKSRCFDRFPFPAWTEPQRAALAEAGERLDAFRKARLAEHPDLTLTRLYNALEAHRAFQSTQKPMTDQEKADFDAGSVLILDEIHRDIDRLTLEAYGWPQDESVEQRLARLVALNAERAAEEAKGEVRWLRPDYQKARFARHEVAGPAQMRDLIGDLPEEKVARPAFPADRTGQHLAVLSRLHAAPSPLSPVEIAAAFKGRNVAPRVESALRALARLGYAQPTPDGRSFQARRAA